VKKIKNCKLKIERRGFTLIELLVIIAIIGILANIILVNVQGIREKAKIAKAEKEVRSLYQALIWYNIDTGDWPVSNNIDSLPEWNSSWKDNYISADVEADPWGTSYFFDGAPDTECGYGQTAICSAGPNKSFESWNRSDMTPQGDDICIYFEPECF